MTPTENLQRLLNPRHVAVVGGESAAQVIRQSRKSGFTGELWPVNPKRDELEGIPCYASTGDLPQAPDAVFIAVPRESTVRVVSELAELGAGGAVCHASGFAEHDARGDQLQRELVNAAGDMALIGPNCIGMLNYLDGVALWPDEHGSAQVDSGVAILTQSGNIGQNLSMQRRGLPIAHLITHGNAASTDIVELADRILDDDRVTAIGLHLEGIGDVARFAEVAIRALRQGVPIIALKSGTSDAGANVNRSHTSSLAGSDVLCDSLFTRVGVARVSDLATFVETLKFLHVHGALPGTSLASASCSGGEAALVADLAGQHGLSLPDFAPEVARKLRAQLGERVTVGNPLDYHTYVWGDFEAQRECFAAYLGSAVDCHLLVVDLPREERCADEAWQTTVHAFETACRDVLGKMAAPVVVSTLPEGMREPVAQRLLSESIAPMQGLASCVEAISAAASIGRAQRCADQIEPPVVAGPGTGPTRQLDERSAKLELAAHGVSVPDGAVVRPEQAERTAQRLGYPVVLKAVSAELAHKTDVGAVRTGLRTPEQVRTAAHELAVLTGSVLVERMVEDVVAELIVGLHRDPRFGAALTLGAGGVHVELLRDTTTLLLPVSTDEVCTALRRLRTWPLVEGFRGQGADVRAVVSAVRAIADFAQRNPTISEIDVNPLLALPPGRGAVAVDALVRCVDEHAEVS